MRRQLRRENIGVFIALGIPVVMANPPVIGWVNDYAAGNPLTLGQPTVWLWLEVWFAVMLVELVLFAAKLPSWQAHHLEEQIEEQHHRETREG